MPSSVTSVFAELDDFRAAMQTECDLDLVVTQPGRFRARVTQVALNCVKAWSIEEHLARVAFLTVPADRVLIVFLIGGRSDQFWDGKPVQAGYMAMLGPNRSVHTRVTGPCTWGALWLPAVAFSHYGKALLGDAFAAAEGLTLVRPEPILFRQLRNIHSMMIRAAHARSDALTRTDAVHGLEQQLIDAAIRCVSESFLPMTPRRRNRNLMINSGR